MTKQHGKSDNHKNFVCMVAAVLFEKENGNYHTALPLFSPLK